MKTIKALLIIAALCISTDAYSADKNPEKCYNIAMIEQKPEFPGGEAAMYRWLSENTVYPANAVNDSVEGRVVVEFEITTEGRTENARVLRGRHPDLDKEALRVVSAMPLWKPGRNNGYPVNVTYTLPVTFRMPR